MVKNVWIVIWILLCLWCGSFALVLQGQDTSFPTTRYRRDAIHITPMMSFTVEVLAVVDYTVFKIWNTVMRNPAESRSAHVNRVKTEIRNYYEHVIKEVDLRYSNIRHTEFQIHVRLAGVVIIEDFESCPWLNGTGDIRDDPRQNDLNADMALILFKLWINQTEGLPTHDHAVLFTKYDLYTSSDLETKTKGKVSHTSGLAYIGTLCGEPGESVSVVEEQGGFQSVGTVTHEIAHSLGALHDGENNTCLSENRFIMAASGFGAVPQAKIFNPWLFSECSIDFFKDFFARMISDGQSCLLSSKIKQKDQNLVSGQMFTPDEQCKMIWGQSSYLCRGPEFGNSSTICTAMYCRDPSTRSDCVLHTAATGTSCDNQKWCQQGRCVYSPEAPVKREGCILGDQPGPAFNGLTCPQLVGRSPSYCYQDKVRARCCESCWMKYTGHRGCEYGNRIQGCRPWHCSMSDTSRDIQTDCCITCNKGEMIFITAAVSTDAPITHTTLDVGKTGQCKDQNISYENICSDIIQTHGRHVCYEETVFSACCRTCSSVATSTKDCVYGDKTPDLCSRMANQTELSCHKFRSQCCESCVNDHGLSGSGSECVHLSIYLSILVSATFNSWMDFG